MFEGEHSYGSERKAHSRPAVHLLGKLSFAALAGALASLGCDQGEEKVEPSQGPQVGLIATYPLDGAGLECLPDSPDDCGVPVNTTIELRFDRFLLPSTATRQGIFFSTGSLGNLVPEDPFAAAPEPRYDVVERVVIYRLPDGQALKPRTLYTVELPVWGVEDEIFGFRAIDGAPMGAHRLPLRFSFYTSAVAEPPPAAQPSFGCADVVKWFARGSSERGRGNCASCHSDSEVDPAPMGLDLEDGNGLIETAIERVAHQTDYGPVTGGQLENPPRFGVGMPLIDSQSAASSYLLYKLLIKPENYRNSAGDAGDCGSIHRVALGDRCLTPHPEEIARLRAHFVRGEPMPLGEGNFLSREQLQGLQAFIRSGARCN